MQIKLFTIPVGDDGRALQEMNAFLRSHKILEVEDHFVSNENGAYWCFCVRYAERAFELTNEKKPGTKTDYREVLSEAVFQKFSKLREIRKQAAANEGVSTFVICTDEELAEMAKLEEITPAALLSIKGIGDKKVERYGKYFIAKSATDEKGEQPN